MGRKKSKIGWIYYWKSSKFVEDETGTLYFFPSIFRTKRDLINRMGNEWANLSKKVKITIEEV